jgi:tetratricopeptide (TPR) repeat protein
MGKQMTYRVALDDKSRNKKGAMAETWMTAAEQSGIPTAFVVNKQGKLAWIGHPMGLNEKVLEEILADKFDVAAYARQYEKGQQEQKQRSELLKRLGMAMREKNWDNAEATLTELEKALPEEMRYRYAITRLQILLGRKDYDAVYKLAETVSDQHKENASFQNGIAWTLATHEGLEKRCLVLAEKIAERANSVAQSKASDILDTLARIQFLLGKKQEAVTTEQKALDIAVDEREKNGLRKTLTAYQQDKLPEAD